MKWISTQKRMPKESGDYFVAIERNGSFFYWVYEYSTRHNAFNASDICNDAKHIVDVTYWAKIKPIKKGRTL